MPVTEQQVRDFFSTIYTDYFTTVEIEKIDEWNGSFLQLVLDSADVRIKMLVGYGEDYEHIVVDGDTLYRSFDKWYTFSRRGIDSSFYSPYSGGIANWDVNLVVLEQIERAENAIKRAQDDGPRITLFPGISVTQARLDEAVKQINSFKKATFTPAGMGTGYSVSRAPERWSQRVSSQVQQLFKCSAPLYYTTIDCD